MLHDGLYLNPHSLARVINMFPYKKWLCIILDGSTRVSEVTDRRSPHYTACLDSIVNTCPAIFATFTPIFGQSCMCVFHLKALNGSCRFGSP